MPFTIMIGVTGLNDNIITGLFPYLGQTHNRHALITLNMNILKRKLEKVELYSVFQKGRSNIHLKYKDSMHLCTPLR